MKINLNYLIILFSLSGLFLVGCNQDRNVYFEYVHIPEEGWSKDLEATFSPIIKDKNLSYNLKIELRHTNDYPYQNIWLFSTLYYQDSLLRNDTIQYLLADDFGEWYGKGYNTLYQQSLIYKDNFIFPDTGKYTIRIEHAMRDNILIGIEDIGLHIETN
ncbi:MAG: gliding motility lipoprotein GldH [Candidatus Azobacteroides sp.]|nr:gliding motility lipoprotein GldH [Candidatus Azobacteroides sp.]